jgi:hypothetical protein
MNRDDFIETLRRRAGLTAVGPSALRGQGKGVLHATQEFLMNLDLSRIQKTNARRYRSWLDRRTESLLDSLHLKKGPWGAARKALNLFMRDIFYNRYLNRRYGLTKIGAWLEVPLDSAVAKGLKRHAGRGNLPQWPGLKNLTPEVSDQFQGFAREHARKKRLHRVHLDIYLWPENR